MTSEKEEEKLLLQCFRLVKAGYGDLNAIKAMSASDFIGALNYEDFIEDYKDKYRELNQK